MLQALVQICRLSAIGENCCWCDEPAIEEDLTKLEIENPRVGGSTSPVTTFQSKIKQLAVYQVHVLR